MPDVADIAREGFAGAYVLSAAGAPVSHRTKATCLVLVESAGELVEMPGAAEFVLEAGRTEGHRDRREADHLALYEYHGAKLAKALRPILARLDTPEISRQAVEHAQAQAQAGSDPVSRRRAVTSLTLAAIAAQVHAEDRRTLDDLNADGWAHASAQGQAEAEATPVKGGPPDTKVVAGLALTALAGITRGGGAAEVASAWTAEQLHTIAMGAALAAGDGKALDEATRKVTQALVDTGRATKTYAMQLHQTVNATFVQSVQARTPEALFDWVCGGPDPCDDCLSDQADSPYSADDLPDCPEHFGCYCGIEQSTSVLAGASA